MSDWQTIDSANLIERLQRREHHFRNAVEGEYDAELLKAARLALASPLTHSMGVGIPIHASRDATNDVLDLAIKPDATGKFEGD